MDRGRIPGSVRPLWNRPSTEKRLRTELRRGLLRSGIAISLSGAVFAILAVMSGALWNFLKWLEFLSPVPGLSGVAILAVGLMVFLLVSNPLYN